MPAAPGVAHDWHLDDRVIALRAALNTGHRLRLFQNNFVPKPGDSYTSFIECTYTGYSSADLTNDFSAPAFVASGQWQIAGTSHPFSWGGGSTQVCYGWYITEPGGNVRFSYLFSSPVTFGTGVTIYIQPIVQDWAYTVVP